MTVTTRRSPDDPNHGGGNGMRQRKRRDGRATLKAMFQPFYTTKSSGLGMGLAISRALIEAHEEKCGLSKTRHWHQCPLYLTLHDMNTQPCVYIVDDDYAVRDALGWLWKPPLACQTFESAEHFLKPIVRECPAACCSMLT